MSLGWDTWHPSTLKNTVLIDEAKDIYKRDEPSFNNLPYELQLYIISYLLEEKYLGGMARVCKRWKALYVFDARRADLAERMSERV